MLFDRRLTDPEMKLISDVCADRGPVAAFNALWSQILIPEGGPLFELTIDADTGDADAGVARGSYAIPADQLRAIADVLVAAARNDAEQDEVLRLLNTQAPAGSVPKGSVPPGPVQGRVPDGNRASRRARGR